MTAPTDRLVNDPGGTAAITGDGYWQIDNLTALPHFLLHVVSAKDHWVYLSSSGGLTAGRVKAARALFPYETDDRLHHAAGINGAVTWIRTADGQLWHPLDARGVAPGRTRSLRKSVFGDWVEFEEAAPDLGLTFRARFTTSERFGLVREASLEGTGGPVEILDGFVNVLPAEVPLSSQQTSSALVDAYKRAEALPGTTLALYVMEAQLSDRAAPAESLRANVVWRTGLADGIVHLTEKALEDFREGASTAPEPRNLGERGAYLVQATVDPAAGPSWSIVGDVHLDHAKVVGLRQHLVSATDLVGELRADIASGREALVGLVSAADGQQLSAEPRVGVNHYANVVYNIMRGGVFARDHDVAARDFARFVQQRNRQVYVRHQAWLAERPDTIGYHDLLQGAAEVEDPQLERLCLEYLPLTFSRRHGDPSRPWNSFNIVLYNDDGTPCYDYEGNWRDIFQNWEALARSFPDFYGAIVAKFVNASTVDGYNPYRLTREGIDWEVPDPEDPWSNIGYWGDHQVVYLFRLVQAAEAHQPGCIRNWLARDLFSYADVPYRIKPYEDLVADAKDTIEFDDAADARSNAQSAALGGDGRLVFERGQVKQVNLLEKFLVCLLAKMSNFVIDGGVWLNTQRPEWNDANNALVGQGLSMVTTAQLRDAFTILGELTDEAGPHPRKFLVSTEVVRWLEEVVVALTSVNPPAEPAPIDAAVRRQVLDRLGQAFSAYRAQVYAHGLSERVSLSAARVVEFCRASRAWVDHTLWTNRRDDGLFHSYNRLAWTPDGVRVARLPMMLEGQVAVLGSGLLSGEASADLVDALYRSPLYRDDQHTFVLYPNQERADFLDRNQLSADAVARTPLLGRLAEDSEVGPRVLTKDPSGTYRWQADLQNASVLERVLDQIGSATVWSELVQSGRAAALEAYETTFHHDAFTGRSGTMHKYEGLGSVYWHMVGKLLVSVQETWRRAVDEQASPEVIERLAQAYQRVRDGLPFNKSAQAYGAVPTDPYSHTPWHLGAQQPGMTGQVKEEVLTRFGELGVVVRKGTIAVEPGLLSPRELTRAATSWTITVFHGAQRTIEVPANSVGFTVAQVPFVVTVQDNAPEVTVVYSDGRSTTAPGRTLDTETAAAVFSRRGKVERVHFRLPRSDLRPADPGGSA